MDNLEKRQKYEIEILEIMVAMYVKGRSVSNCNSISKSDSCSTAAALSKQECDDFLKYAVGRVNRCPKGIHKTSCRRCEIHCYTSEQRRRAKLIMSYSGPRFIFYHPVMAVWHLFHEVLIK